MSRIALSNDKPDTATLRRLIARDLAGLDPWRRRRYQTRLRALLAEAERGRIDGAQARAGRSAWALLACAMALTAAAALLAGAIMLDMGDAPMLRMALGAAGSCVGLIGWDAAQRADRPPARREDETDPAETALVLHRRAYASLGYAVGLPAAPPDRKLLKP
jgi:hypothetical protein